METPYNGLPYSEAITSPVTAIGQQNAQHRLAFTLP